MSNCDNCGEDIYDHCIYCTECDDADHSECERQFNRESNESGMLPVPKAPEDGRNPSFGWY